MLNKIWEFVKDFLTIIILAVLIFIHLSIPIWGWFLALILGVCLPMASWRLTQVMLLLLWPIIFLINLWLVPSFFTYWMAGINASICYAIFGAVVLSFWHENAKLNKVL